MNNLYKSIDNLIFKNISKTETFNLILNTIFIIVLILSLQHMEKVDITWTIILFGFSQFLYSILLFIGHYVEFPFMYKKNNPLFYMVDFTLYMLYEWKKVTIVDLPLTKKKSVSRMYIVDVCYNLKDNPVFIGDKEVLNIQEQFNVDMKEYSKGTKSIKRKNRLQVVIVFLLSVIYVVSCILFYKESSNIQSAIYIFIGIFILKILILNIFSIYCFFVSAYRAFYNESVLEVFLLLKLSSSKTTRRLFGRKSRKYMEKAIESFRNTNLTLSSNKDFYEIKNI